MAKKLKPDFAKIREEQKRKLELENEYAQFKNKSFQNCPLVVIAGRPNVGKSTLFNRFMRKKIAITDPTPGVTRDPVESVALIAGKPVRLVDTGGYKLERIIGSKEADIIPRSIEFIFFRSFEHVIKLFFINIRDIILNFKQTFRKVRDID